MGHEARGKVLVKLNVAAADLDAVIALVPSMKSPTVSELFGKDGYAVETVVAKNTVYHDRRHASRIVAPVRPAGLAVERRQRMQHAKTRAGDFIVEFVRHERDRVQVWPCC